MTDEAINSLHEAAGKMGEMCKGQGGSVSSTGQAQGQAQGQEVDKGQAQGHGQDGGGPAMDDGGGMGM